jgi:molybdenum cofactor cytidylyltransferase
VLAAVILAAGESRRMGHPKALMPYPFAETTPGKLTFLEHLLTLVRHPQIGPVRVVLGAHAEKVQERLKLNPSTVVINDDWKHGQLSSIHAAIHSLAKEKNEGVILFLVDHPLITQRLVAMLIEAFHSSKAPIVLPVYKGQRGHPVIFASRLYPELLAAPADTGARAVVWAHAAEVREVPTDEQGITLNLNEPDALRRAIRK